MKGPIFLEALTLFLLMCCCHSYDHLEGKKFGRKGKLENRILSNWQKFWSSLHDPLENAEADEGKGLIVTQHRIMGNPDKECDNARDRLEVDWDGSPADYTCYQPKAPFPWREDLPSILKCDNIPRGYLPEHVCINHEIKYDSVLPTHQKHRPLWAVFGEYLYVPTQRWLHNVEHGSIIMLYHPCTQPLMVSQLKSILKSCIRKHVITSNVHLNKDRPLALVGWGCSIQMNQVNTVEVVRFIKAHGLKGPEGRYSKEGQYNVTLLEKAQAPSGSDLKDSVLCPYYN